MNLRHKIAFKNNNYYVCVSKHLSMKIYVVSGEASGDLHASNLVKEFQKIHTGDQFRGMGGDLLAAQGMEIVQHIKDTNFMGFWEVIKNLYKIYKIMKAIQEDIISWQPDVVILVDYPGFNLRLAKFLKKKGIRVFYYISPQVWAWKKGRVKQIKEYVEKMFVILPFEKEFYKNEGLAVEYVGHPFLDAILPIKGKENNLRKECKLGDKPIIAMLPGSRPQEISRMLPIMLAVKSTFPQFQFVVAGAPNQPNDTYLKIMGENTVPVIPNKTYELLNISSFALVTSGTATLETALLGIPEVVCYKGSALSFYIAKKIVDIKYISLVNLVLDKECVKELIQNDFDKNHLATELTKLIFDNHYRENIITEYKLLTEKLGNSGASKKAAISMLKLLGIK